MNISIATNSADKISGIKKALSRFFTIKESEINVKSQRVDSGVSEQPFDEEVYQGAINRVNSLITPGQDFDFYISCEAGVEGFLGIYSNVQVVCIFDTKSQQYIFGKSAGWQIPSEDIEVIKKGNLDSYLKQKGISKLEDLLGEGNSRANAVAQATEMALCAMKLNPLS